MQRFKVNLNIQLGEQYIDSLKFLSDCIVLVERDDACEGVVLDVPEGCNGEFTFQITTIHGQTITDTRRLCGYCEDCEACEGNLCVPVCEDDEYCDGNYCVECLEDFHCGGGKKCIQGTCNCPTGSIWDGTNCVFVNNCPPCHDHNPLTNECTKIECPGQVCNPTNNECVDCFNSSHCGQNENCKNNECKCIEGYVRSPFTGNCIPAQECQVDSDCFDCYECKNSQCKEKVCPDGHVCVEDECIILCENGQCPQGLECIDGVCSTPPADCNFPQISEIEFGYNCSEGLRVETLPLNIFPEFLELSIGEQSISLGQAINPGTYDITVFYVNCEVVKKDVIIPTCYSCDTGTCLPQTPNLGLLLGACQATCTQNPQPPTQS